MDSKKWGIVLFVFLSVLFAIRMYIALSTPYLTYDSYLEVRSTEHIIQTGLPLRVDPLRIDSASRLLHPIFSYILAGFVLFTPLMYKIIPNLLMVLALIPVYLLTKRLTQSDRSAMIAVILSGTGPLFFSSYIATPSAVPLALLLILTTVYLFLDPEKHLFWLILCTILLTFIHPLIFVLVISLLVIMLLLKLEGFGVDSRVNELFFFTLLLAVWFYVLVYKNVLFHIGSRILFENIPLTGSSDASISVFLYGLGIITFLFGAIGMYQSLFVGKEKTMYVVIAPIIAVIVLLLSGLLYVPLGILLLTPFLAILASYGIMISFEFIQKTKFPRLKYLLVGTLVIFFVFGAIIPMLASANRELQNIPSNSQVESYITMKELVPDTGVVLTTIREAYAVQYFSNKKTVTDADLLLVRNPDEQINDVDSVYTARFALTVIDKSIKLGATNILFSKDAQKQYSRERLLIDTPDCMRITQIKESLLYSLESCSGSKT